MDTTEVSIIHHVCIVLLLLCLLSWFNCCPTIVYFLSLAYLYLVHERYIIKLRKKLKFEERRHANQRRVLTDFETVRWLNHALEKIWPVCMEQIVSQKILLPIIPWFLQKYKPWTAKEAVIQHLYLGRSPPIFTEMKVLHQSTDDDHLVLELGMNFQTADDMSAVLSVKLRKRLGFGMWAKLHLMGMHIEGKVLFGVKFLRSWPFLGRLRVCFVEPPYVQMTVKPMFTHGIDVTELPGIAGWVDKLLAVAFEQTLVEPNMLVVDMEKFATPKAENWFSVIEKDPVAYVVVEVIEGANLKASDSNGSADLYVQGQIGPYRFRTHTQRKTRDPKWLEEFKIPICIWESSTILTMEVRDKDLFVNATLGDCTINLSDLRDGQRHDMWLSLLKVKMGRLHLAITVVECNRKADQQCDTETLKEDDERYSFASETVQRDSFSSESSVKSSKVADKLEPIDIEGQEETGIWVHQPGDEVSRIWEARKGKSRVLDAQICSEGSSPSGSFRSTVSGSFQNDNSSSNDESLAGKKEHRKHSVRRGLHKFSSVFGRNSKKDDKSSSIVGARQSPHANFMPVGEKELCVNDNLHKPSPVEAVVDTPEESAQEISNKGEVKGMAKSILKHAGKSARGIRHALSPRGSRKPQGNQRLLKTGKGAAAGSEFSDEESLLSPIYTPRVELIPYASSPMSSCGNDAFKSNEHVQMSSSKPAVNIEDQS